MTKRITPLFVLILLLMSGILIAQENTPIDHQATQETKALYINLQKISKTHILFGHQHLCAFTETGLESIPNSTWWTDVLLRVIKTYRMPLAYVLVWPNDTRSPTHYYAPYPGQVSEADFIKFYNDDYTLFENDLKNIYRNGK